MDEQSIFLEALEKTTADEVSEWLKASCGEDKELRERVEALLRHHHEANSFLDGPIDEVKASRLASMAAAISSGPASVLRAIGKRYGEIKGVSLQDAETEFEDPVVQPSSSQVPNSDVDSRYQLLGEIARGGMGAVIKGRDSDLGRDLAVKVLLDEHKDKPEVVQRFVEEAQIGGQLQHPGVAPIYELGQFGDQRPFFTMKLVKGKTLAALLSQRETLDQDLPKLLGIFEQICQTMAYAHSRNVIHRDLKPANIMVGAFREVQVMDWGLAKVLQVGGIADETKATTKQKDLSVIETIRSVGSNTFHKGPSVGSQTRAGSVMGTPAYMPPEQAMGDTDALDERVDVFGLGAILCEILTGSPPYVADDGKQVLQMAVRGDLEDCQRRLNHSSAHPELIDLARQCLNAVPSKRFKEAGAVADIITSHLESVARKLKQAEMRRKLTYMVAASLLLLVTGLGIGGVWLQAKETEAANQVAAAERQRTEEKEVANQELQESLYAAKIQLAGSHIESGRMIDGNRILESLRPERQAEDLRGFEWHYLKRQCQLPVTNTTTDWDRYLAGIPKGHFSPWLRRTYWISEDGNRMLVRWGLPTFSVQPVVRTYKLSVFDRQLMREVWSEETRSRKFCLSHNGKQIAIFKNPNIYEDPNDVMQIIDVDSGEHVTLPLPNDGPTPLTSEFYRLAFSPTGEHLASITAYRPAGGGNRQGRAGNGRREGNRPGRGGNRQGRGLRTARPTTLILWNTKTRTIQYQKELPGTTTPDGFVFSPDGSRMLTVDIDQSEGTVSSTITVWDVASGDKVRAMALDPGQLPLLRVETETDPAPSFSPDGSLIALSGTNLPNAGKPALWIWELQTGQRIFSRETSSSSTQPPTFSPDNKLVLHHGGDLFRIRDGKRLVTLGSFVNSALSDVQISEQGQSIEGVTVDGRRLRWRSAWTESGADGRGLLAVSANGASRVRRPHWQGSPEVEDQYGNRVPLQFPVNMAAIMRGGPRGTVAVSDDARYLALQTADVPRAELTPDTPLALTVWNMSDSTRHAILWRQKDNEQLVAARFVPKRGSLLGIVRIGTANEPTKYRLLFWDVENKRLLHSLELPDINWRYDPSFSPDGKQMALRLPTRGDDDTNQSYVSIYSLSNMQESHRIAEEARALPGIAFRPGRNEIVVKNRRGSVDLWDLDTKTIRLSFPGNHFGFGWTADGKRFISVRNARNRNVRSIMTVWNPENGQCLLVHGTPFHGGGAGHSVKPVRDTDKLFSRTGQYLDGTPLDQE